MNDKSGGPVFPVLDLSKTQCPGMTVRAFAAIHVAAALATDDDYAISTAWPGNIASDAVKLADAVIAELEKESA